MAADRAGTSFVVGVDEVGRGPLAGPVVAAAVLLGPTKIDGMADSKRLSAARRAELSAAIIEECLAYCIEQSSVMEIEQLGILEATMMAMQRAVSGIVIVPDRVIVDGDRAPDLPYPVEALVKGDEKIPEIMAASIIAKHHRDALMDELERECPGYGFASNKGYGTEEHLAALAKLGPCKHHRAKFAPVAELLKGREG